MERSGSSRQSRSANAEPGRTRARTCGARRADCAGEVVSRYDDRLDLRDGDPVARFRRLLDDLNLCNPVFGLARRDALAGTRLIGGYVAADRVLLAELVLSGRVFEIDEPLFFRRLHGGGSQFKNRTPEEVAAWFEPGRRGTPPCPSLRLLREHAAAIHRAPLTMTQKARCAGVLLRVWLPRNWRVMGGEVKDRLRHLLKGSRAAAG